jgi:hypothetical protein
MLATERAWFKHAAMLGTVLLDNIDHDWSFVALGKDQRGQYRGFDLGTSYPRAEATQLALEKDRISAGGRVLIIHAGKVRGCNLLERGNSTRAALTVLWK